MNKSVGIRFNKICKILKNIHASAILNNNNYTVERGVMDLVVCSGPFSFFS